MKLSPHFTLEEFTISDTGARFGIDNTPSPTIIRNLRGTATFLEDIRLRLRGLPIHISSGYRCDSLNTLVGGSPNSAHIQGCAADFIAPAYGDPLAVCKSLHATIADFPIDQLIWEFSWVHVAFSATPRRQLLVRNKQGVQQVKHFPDEIPIA